MIDDLLDFFNEGKAQSSPLRDSGMDFGFDLTLFDSPSMGKSKDDAFSGHGDFVEGKGRPRWKEEGSTKEFKPFASFESAEEAVRQLRRCTQADMRSIGVPSQLADAATGKATES